MIIFFIYRFYNAEKELIYIGKTINSYKSRIRSHFYQPQCYSKWKQKIEYYDFAKIDNESDLEVAEIYLINKYKPIYNYSNKGEGKLNLELNQKFEFSDIKDIREIIDNVEYYKHKLQNYINKFNERKTKINNVKKDIVKTLPSKIPGKIINKINQLSNSNKYIRGRNKVIFKLILFYGLKIKQIIDLDLKDIKEDHIIIGDDKFIIVNEMKDDLYNFVECRKRKFGKNINGLFLSLQKRRISRRSIQKACKEIFKDKTPEELRKYYKEEYKKAKNKITI